MQRIEVRDGCYVQFDADGGLMGVRVDNRIPNTTSVPIHEALVIHDELPLSAPEEREPAGEYDYTCPCCAADFALSEDRRDKSVCHICGVTYTGDLAEEGVIPVLTAEDWVAVRKSRGIH